MKKLILGLLGIICSFSMLNAQQNVQQAINATDTRFIKEWINEGHDVNSVLYINEQKMTPLAYASQIGNAEMVRLLMKSGADIHLKVDFQDALMFAAVSGNMEILEALINAGANPMNENKMGKCARDIAQDNLHTAAYNFLKLETEKRLNLIRSQRRK